MPKRDGTGPKGMGSMTGKGIGYCTGANRANYGAGLGIRAGLACRCGLGRSFAANSSKSEKELLYEQRHILQERLDVIDKQLKNL